MSVSFLGTCTDACCVIMCCVWCECVRGGDEFRQLKLQVSIKPGVLGLGCLCINMYHSLWLCGVGRVWCGGIHSYVCLCVVVWVIMIVWCVRVYVYEWGWSCGCMGVGNDAQVWSVKVVVGLLGCWRWLLFGGGEGLLVWPALTMHAALVSYMGWW